MYRKPSPRSRRFDVSNVSTSRGRTRFCEKRPDVSTSGMFRRQGCGPDVETSGFDDRTFPRVAGNAMFLRVASLKNVSTGGESPTRRNIALFSNKKMFRRPGARQTRRNAGRDLQCFDVSTSFFCETFRRVVIGSTRRPVETSYRRNVFGRFDG